MTRTGEIARLRQHAPIPVLELHPDDATQLTVRDGEFVCDDAEQQRLRVHITTAQRRGDAFAAMHWTQQFAATAVINESVAATVDRHSGEPAFKHSQVKWRAWRPRWQALLLSRDELPVRVGQYFSLQCLENGYATELAGDDNPDWLRWFNTQTASTSETLSMHDAAKGEMRAAHLYDGQLQQLLLVTHNSTLPAYTWLASLLSKNLSTSERRALLSGVAPTGAVDDSALICSCFSVRQNTILAAIQQHDLDSVSAIGAHLKAGSNCGSCKPELRRLLQQFQLV